MRARITRELIEKRGFTIVAAEADWPDAARVDRYVRHGPAVPEGDPAFRRFPTWMWKNAEVHDFVEWLRSWNADVSDPARRAGFYGLDLYSLFTSIAAVLRYLDDVDPDTAALARRRYACLTPWERDPAVYGRATLTGRVPELRKAGHAHAPRHDGAPARVHTARRRALPGCDPERAAGGRCGALLPRDVLRPGGVVEFA